MLVRPADSKPCTEDGAISNLRDTSRFAVLALCPRMGALSQLASRNVAIQAETLDLADQLQCNRHLAEALRLSV